jgi:hypothetical protein
VKRGAVQHLLAIAARLLDDTHTRAEHTWVAAQFEREANAALDRRRRAHRPRKNDNLYCGMTFDRFLNDR